MKHVTFITASVLALALLITGCSRQTGSDQKETTEAETTAATTASPVDTMTLNEIVDSLLEASKDYEFPSMYRTELELKTDSLFKHEFGIDPPEGAEEALSVSAQINIVPFSLCVLRLKEGSDAVSVAKEVRTHADPNKWVCVSASTVEVRSASRVVLLVMDTNAERASCLADAFEALSGSPAR